MLIEIPEFRRCCFCLPLRRGILVFGYLSLALTSLFTILQIVLWTFFHDVENAVSTSATLYRGVVMEAQLGVIFFMNTLDILFHIVLIVGAHMKKRRLLLVFYYYELTTMVATFFVVLITYIDIKGTIVLTEFALAFTGFGMGRNYSTPLATILAYFFGFVHIHTSYHNIFIHHFKMLQVYLLLLVRSELSKDRYQEGRSSFINHIAEVLIEPPLRRQWRTAL